VSSPELLALQDIGIQLWNACCGSSRDVEDDERRKLIAKGNDASQAANEVLMAIQLGLLRFSSLRVLPTMRRCGLSVNHPVVEASLLPLARVATLCGQLRSVLVRPYHTTFAHEF
jgi:hypothetical protein